MFALLIGSCLGGNLTPFGASANVVAMGILKKEEHPINFAGFLKIGAPFTILTTAVAALVLVGLFHINVLFIIIGAAFVGIIYHQMKKGDKS